MKNKRFGLVVIISVLICMFSGCVKKTPPVDELVKKAWSSVSSVDAKFRLDTEATNGSHMVIDISSVINSDSRNTYIRGSAKTKVMKNTSTVPIKTYITKIKGKQYSLSWEDSDSVWIKNKVKDVSGLSNLDSSVFKSCSVTEVTNKEYKIKGVVDYNTFMEKLGLSSSDLLGEYNTKNMDLTKIKLNTEMTIDKETGFCKRLNLIADTKTLVSKEFMVNDFSIKLKVNKVKGVAVKVPKTVLNSAIDIASLGKQTLSQYLLGLDQVYADDIKDILKNKYKKLPSNDVINSIVVTMNDTTADKFAESLRNYSKWNKTDKKALAVMTNIGLFDTETLNMYGVNIKELKALIKG